MSYINEIEFDFEPGDAYELSPIEMLYVVGQVRELGGQVYIDGNVLIITEMPGKTAKTTPQTPQPDPPKVTWFAPEPTPAPVEAEIPAPVEPEAVENEEAPAAVSEGPIKRARKTAAKSEEPVSDEPVPAPVEE